MKVLFKSKLLFFITCTVIFCLVACGEQKHPKDEELIANFESHKAEFNHLLQMFQADKNLGRVTADFTRTSDFFEKCPEPNNRDENENEVSEEQLNEYRKLFNFLGLSAGIEGYCEKKSVLFYSSTKGLSVTGSTKGYAYLQNAPKNLVDNLDDYWSKDGKSFTAYRQIEGNWYLYLNYED